VAPALRINFLVLFTMLSPPCKIKYNVMVQYPKSFVHLVIVPFVRILKIHPSKNTTSIHSKFNNSFILNNKILLVENTMIYWIRLELNVFLSLG
jgi:hypothetical protein